jgi:hypothetical protein
MDILPFTYFAASISLGLLAASASHQKAPTSQPTQHTASSGGGGGGSAKGRKGSSVSPEIKAEMLSRISSFFGEDKFAGIQVDDL